MPSQKKRLLVLLAALSFLVLACTTSGPRRMRRHAWWKGLGPVVPHESFPADCKLCHVGREWNTLRPDFEFDHAAETGYILQGAHSAAQCLRCHNDRGPVEEFTAIGCAGCHEDIHVGQLGTNCQECHQQQTWQAFGQVERHNRTRFPLLGVHATTPCWRCHAGADVGRFVPTDVACVTCHRDDLARATNPNHINLGYVDNCDRCHQPRNWNEAAGN